MLIEQADLIARATIEQGGCDLLEALFAVILKDMMERQGTASGMISALRIASAVAMVRLSP